MKPIKLRRNLKSMRSRTADHHPQDVLLIFGGRKVETRHALFRRKTKRVFVGEKCLGPVSNRLHGLDLIKTRFDNQEFSVLEKAKWF